MTENNKKFYAKVTVIAIVLGVLTFCITYKAWNVHMDNKINEAFSSQVKEEAKVVELSNIKYKDKTYDSLKDIESKLSNGDTLSVTVKYEDNTTSNKKAYVVTARSNSIKEVIYSDVPDSNVGQIILPKNNTNNSTKSAIESNRKNNKKR